MKSRALSLKDAAFRLGYSYGHARRLVAEGKFPVPVLPRTSPRSWVKVSEDVVDRYLQTASTDDARKGAA